MLDWDHLKEIEQGSSPPTFSGVFLGIVFVVGLIVGPIIYFN